MQQNLLSKIEKLSLRLKEIDVSLADNETIKNPKIIKELAIERTQLLPIAENYAEYLKTKKHIKEAQMLLNNEDIEIREMAKKELHDVREALKAYTNKIQMLLLPKDKNDSRNVILEIRAGTGGNEASLFAGDLLKMYLRFAEKKHWQSEIISSSVSEYGGFKEVICKISGQNVYEKLKFESGTHRVQRIPETESQGRIHTSATTVAIMPEVKHIEEVDIDMKDVRIDTFRASGAGGQHVNKTDSAVRLTHLPSNTVVECQDSRSQHKNKAQAFSILAARILYNKQQIQQQAQAISRKQMVGSGDRSERIRTYNYPQGRITDHRINLTLYKLNDALEGELDAIIEELMVANQTKQMSAYFD